MVVAAVRPVEPDPAVAAPAALVDVALSLAFGLVLVQDAPLLPGSGLAWSVAIVQLLVGAAAQWWWHRHPGDALARTLLLGLAPALVLLASAASVARELPPTLADGALAQRLVVLGAFTASSRLARFVRAGLIGPVALASVSLEDGERAILRDAPPELARDLRDAVALVLVALLVTLIGRTAAERRRVEQATADRVEQALAAERARIARELHDVVAHEMTGVVLQAQGAAAVLDASPARARAALGTIETSARRGLEELRRLLGVLREDEAASGALVLLDQSRGAVGKGVGDIPALLEAHRATLPTLPDDPSPEDLAELPDDEALAAVAAAVTRPGRIVLRASIDDGAAEAPAGVQASAHRIVQEALTNVARHVGRASVAVRVRPVEVGGRDALEVVIRNGPATGARPDVASGSGLGLVGMRERALALGGRLEVGPTEDGGWEVRATLPLDPPGPPALGETASP